MSVTTARQAQDRTDTANPGTSPGTDTASTIIVLAKQPRPGRVKTRLQTAFTAPQSAALAAAALDDTLVAVRGTAVPRRILAFDGDPTGWDTGLEVITQGDGNLADRLGRVFDRILTERPGEPALLIAMDTPQVTPALLGTSWDGADAVIGLSEDGGYWAIGLRHGPAAAVFADVPMSTDRTGAAQLARLLDLGYRVKLLPPLRDVDTPDDAARLAEACPRLGFSRLYRHLTTGSTTPVSVRGIFDHAYAVGRLAATTAVGTDPLRVTADLWQHAADAVDDMVIARCRPPVIDIGCGPGRMVAALIGSGMPALGVDLSATAVELSNRRGGLALRRDVAGPIPGTARWGTVLLMDSNIGMGGDVPALLRRCAQLARPGGLIICEHDIDPMVDQSHIVQLRSGALETQLPWASVGIEALAAAAAQVNLLITERWSAGRRSFVTLQAM